MVQRFRCLEGDPILARTADFTNAPFTRTGRAPRVIPLGLSPIPTSYGTRVRLKVPVAYALV